MQQQRAALSAQGHSQGHHGAVSRSCTHTHTRLKHKDVHVRFFVQTHRRATCTQTDRNGDIFVDASSPVTCKVTSRHINTHTASTHCCSDTDAAVCPLLLQELTNYLVHPHTRSHTHVPHLSVGLDGFKVVLTQEQLCLCRYSDIIYNT